MDDQKIHLRSYLILGLLSIVWGSSFILMKKALISFPPFTLAAMRIAISGLAFLPIIIINWKKIPWEKWKYFLLVGLTGSGIPAFMYFLAQTNINSTVSGLLNSLTPIFTFIIGILFFGSKSSRSKIIGITLGFLGAALLIMFAEEKGQNKNLWYGLFVVIGTMCYGVSGNVVKHYFQDVKSTIISGLSFVMISIPAIIYLLIDGQLFAFQGSTQEWYSLSALVALALIGTVWASVLFYQLVQNTNAVFGSSVAYLMPIVAILWGIIDGEVIGPIIFVSIATILFGVHLIRK